MADISSRSNFRSVQREDMVMPWTRTRHLSRLDWNALPVYRRSISISRGEFRTGAFIFNQAYTTPLGLSIPGSRIPGSRTVFQFRNPGIMNMQSREFRDPKMAQILLILCINCVENWVISTYLVISNQRLFYYHLIDWRCMWQWDLIEMQRSKRDYFLTI